MRISSNLGRSSGAASEWFGKQPRDTRSVSAAERTFPKTDKGWQAWLTSARPPRQREWPSLGGALRVRLEPGGLKVFEARLRRRGDKNPRTIEIGSFPTLSVADARRKIAEMRSLIREGGDPALVARRARAGVEALRTLSALIDEYLTRRQVAPKTLKIERDLLKGVLAPALGDRLLSDLEPVDFGKAIAGYAARLRQEGRSNGTNANKLLGTARRMYKLARGWGLYAGADPTVGLMKPAKEIPRDRILFDGEILVGPDPRLNEIGRLVLELEDDNADSESAPTRAALMLTLRLGFRAAEVCSLEWRTIDLGDSPSLAVTFSKTKAGLRTLPLPKAATETLKRLRRAATGPWVFPARSDAKRAPHIHSESLSRAFARVCDRIGIAEVTTHDLRRTCISGLIELGHEGLSRRIAGHQGKDVTTVHYDRARRVEAMRAALEDWSTAVDAAAARARAVSRVAK